MLSNTTNYTFIKKVNLVYPECCEHCGKPMLTATILEGNGINYHVGEGCAKKLLNNRYAQFFATHQMTFNFI